MRSSAETFQFQVFDFFRELELLHVWEVAGLFLILDPPPNMSHDGGFSRPRKFHLNSRVCLTQIARSLPGSGGLGLLPAVVSHRRAVSL